MPNFLNSFSDFQNQAASMKVALVKLEASKRLMGWVVYSGSIYKIFFDQPVVSSLSQNGVALTLAASVSAITAGKYFYEPFNKFLYVRMSDSTHPNANFVSIVYPYFFSNIPVSAPWDLNTGFKVPWLPLLKGSSSFGVEMDNEYQLGEAIEGTGTLTFFNDQDFWQPIFDKVYFENQKVNVYVWNPDLLITDAQLLFRGTVQGKSYSVQEVGFTLQDQFNELRAPIVLQPMTTIPGISNFNAPPNIQQALRRVIYGFGRGVRPVNYDQLYTNNLAQYVTDNSYPPNYDIDATGGTGKTYWNLLFTITFNATTLLQLGSTDFLRQLTAGDQILLIGDTDFYTIKSVTDSHHAELTEAYRGRSKSGAIGFIKPKLPSRFVNRDHHVAGHNLREPTTTVVSSNRLDIIQVADATDFHDGDAITVHGELTSILRVSMNFIELRNTLSVLAPPGASVVKNAISNVYLNNNLLENGLHYTYETTGYIHLNPLCEFYLAPIQSADGSVTFTNGSRVVTGTGTTFKADFVENDWITVSGHSDWYEILSVDSDTQITLRTPSAFDSSPSNIWKKHPATYQEGTDVISCDALGKTSNGNSTAGFLLGTAADIVKDLLKNTSSLSTIINSGSFDTAKVLLPQRLSLVIPDTYDGKTAPVLKDLINQINQSVFAALIQNENFDIEYQAFSPQRPSSYLALSEGDILDWSVQSNSDRIVQSTQVNYGFQEYSPLQGAGTNSLIIATSLNATYLAGSTRTKLVDTLLLDESDANIFARRWAFILEVADSLITFQTKMQGIKVKVTDPIALSHRKLYQRVGSSMRRKIALVSSSKKTHTTCEIIIEDLANAMSRCATITENDANPFISASEEELLINGYITDSYGMQSNDSNTFGANLIW